MGDQTLQRTPLFQWHTAHGGKIVPFAGWELPVQYTGVVAEHQAVRERAGLFDVSHMGELTVQGPDALRFLQQMSCNDVSKIGDGKAQYNALLNEQGGVIDDIIVYREGADNFFVCVNAVNTAEDFAWLAAHAKEFNVQVRNVSAEYGQIAIQGPCARAIVARGAPEVSAIAPFHFKRLTYLGVPVMVARTGYTGEDGFELFVPWARTEEVWSALLRDGGADGALPCGLGARDSLRLEACYPLHGHELSPQWSAIESGLGWIVKLEKGHFTGSSVLATERQHGAARALIGFQIDEPGIARQGDKVFSPDGCEVGVVTSGTIPPTVKKAVGMAMVQSKVAALGTALSVEVRGRRLRAAVVKRPFYARPQEKPRAVGA